MVRPLSTASLAAVLAAAACGGGGGDDDDFSFGSGGEDARSGGNVGAGDGGAGNAAGTTSGASGANAGREGWGGDARMLPEPRPGLIELCDGLDNNGDGRADEGCVCDPEETPVQRCYVGDPTRVREAEIGECFPGTQECVLRTEQEIQVGRWTACAGYRGPTDEICDGRDNDCDGAVDEGCGATGDPGGSSGGSGTGTGGSSAGTGGEGTGGGNTGDPGCPEQRRDCATPCGPGEQRCVNGVWGECEGTRLPAPEQCNGEDDDCDGTVDDFVEGCTDSCGLGSRRCMDGTWSACSTPEPLPEVCNGRDDDCDDATDENVVEACSTLCGAGTRRCEGGTWTACDAPAPTGSEVCDNRADDDCDGLIDCEDLDDCADDCVVPPPPPEECEGTQAVYPAEPIPLDMIVKLDRSLTMKHPVCEGGCGPADPGDCNVGEDVGSRWCNAINALDDYFNDPAAVGNSVRGNNAAALQFFEPSEGGYTCGGSGINDVAVPLLPLPGNAPALRDALNAADPLGWLTPTEAAVRGLATQTASPRTGRAMVGVLVTDGIPDSEDAGFRNTCTENWAELATLVRNHFLGTGVPLFMVGMNGADFGFLEELAVEGGAPEHTDYCGGGQAPCHYYDVGDGDGAAFAAAMAAIQRRMVNCNFEAPPGSHPDRLIVRVNGTELPNVGGISSCGTGWYVDYDVAPTSVTLCPDSCALANATENPSVELEVTCDGPPPEGCQEDYECGAGEYCNDAGDCVEFEGDCRFDENAECSGSHICAWNGSSYCCRVPAPSGEVCSTATECQDSYGKELCIPDAEGTFRCADPDYCSVP